MAVAVPARSSHAAKEGTIRSWGPAKSFGGKSESAALRSHPRGVRVSSPQMGRQGKYHAAAAGAGAATFETKATKPPAVKAEMVEHPSWIAARLRKEKEQSSNTAFAGKKKTFDD